MSLAHTQTPSCYGLFEAAAPECADCALSPECLQQQVNTIRQLQKPKQPPKPKADANATKHASTPAPDHARIVSLSNNTPSRNAAPLSGAQIIRKHTRKRLPIPPVGTRLQTIYAGQVHHAVVVADPANQRGEGRSILYQGQVYKTLTAAAHAISPGIHSGSVWSALDE